MDDYEEAGAEIPALLLGVVRVRWVMPEIHATSAWHVPEPRKARLRDEADAGWIAAEGNARGC